MSDQKSDQPPLVSFVRIRAVCGSALPNKTRVERWLFGEIGSRTDTAGDDASHALDGSTLIGSQSADQDDSDNHTREDPVYEAGRYPSIHHEASRTDRKEERDEDSYIAAIPPQRRGTENRMSEAECAALLLRLRRLGQRGQLARLEDNKRQSHESANSFGILVQGTSGAATPRLSAVASARSMSPMEALPLPAYSALSTHRSDNESKGTTAEDEEGIVHNGTGFSLCGQDHRSVM